MLNFPGCLLCFPGFENLGYLLIFLISLDHGLKCGSRIEDVEDCSLGGDVGADSFFAPLEVAKCFPLL